MNLVLKRPLNYVMCVCVYIYIYICSYIYRNKRTSINLQSTVYLISNCTACFGLCCHHQVLILNKHIKENHVNNYKISVRITPRSFTKCMRYVQSVTESNQAIHGMDRSLLGGKFIVGDRQESQMTGGQIKWSETSENCYGPQYDKIGIRQGNLGKEKCTAWSPK